MKTKDRDPQSYFAIVDSFLRQAELNQQEYSLLAAELKRYLDVKFKYGNYVHPVITKFCTDWYREFYRLIGYKDPYKNLKVRSNEEAKKILPTLQVDTFLDKIKISIKGNKLDFGAVLVFNPDLNQLAEEFKDVNDLQLSIDDTKELQEAIKKAKNILFLTDNAGEIIFDFPLLEYLSSILPKHHLFIGAKECPMLNDITISELKELGLDKYGQLVSTGSNCFGLHEEDVSIDFKRILKEADLIIAKGQAYLEFFTEYNFENVFNIAQIKYPIIDEALGILEPYQNVVISSKRYAKNNKPYQFGTLHPKIVERSSLRQLSNKLKTEGKTIVTINGSFDIMHLGHIRMLEHAKKQGDVLMVGVSSDSAVKQSKAESQLINPQQNRAEFVASLACVDYVFIFDEATPKAFLKEICPHCNYTEQMENFIEAETISHDKNAAQIHQPDKPSALREIILDTIKKQQGIIFAKPALVYRETYSGRDILAKNSKFMPGYVDERNYVPVEWWVMSITQAQNAIMKDNEGLTILKINNQEISLKEASSYCEIELLGNYKRQWPLTKILDIGGNPVKTSFSEQMEIPPIPVHLHSGMVKEGKIQPPGKLEAYFFPPVDVPPYHQEFGRTITRLGLKPETTKEQFQKGLTQFGLSDEIYSLCNVYEVRPYDGWTIKPGTVHAPGPWITFEIQQPQDDFNLASWRLGQRLDKKILEEKRQALQLKGLKDEDDFIKQTVDWGTSTDPEFKKNHYRPSKIIEEGNWGKRLQIFFDEFYGEAWELKPGQAFTRSPDERPFAGIVWSGFGKINNHTINVKKEKEFLVVPHTAAEIINTGDIPLLMYTVFPIQKRKTIINEIQHKIKSRAELKEIVKNLKRAGKKIVHTNGVYDLLHSGHLYLLWEAKKLGDILIVSINSDASVQRFKGKDRPVLDENERSAMLAALEMVDYVTIYPEDESLYTIEHLKPDIHVKGRSVIEERIKKEKDLVESWGGRMQIFPLELGNSTSNIIKKIIETEK